MTMRALGRCALIALSLLLLSAPASPASAAGEPYIIGPEDVLDVQVWDNKDLNFGGFVRPDGKISLPLLGEVHAAGKTVQQLQDELTRLYEKTIKQPLVTVIVKEIKSRPVYFVGGFARPGAIQLTRELTLLQAASTIGGVAAGADAEKAYLLRGDKAIPIDLDKLLKKGDLSQNLRLEPGDTVILPVAELVYVQGQVRHAGVVKYTEDLTLVKAIAKSGGLTPMAAGGRVDILRKEGEKRVRLRVDLANILAGDKDSLDVNLKPEDIIFVPERFF